MSGACFAAGVGSVAAGGGGGGGGITTGNATTGFSASSDNAPTVNVPAGAVSGDFFILAVNHNSAHTMTWPAGFTDVGVTATEGATFGMSLHVAIRTATGSESGTFASTTSGYAAWFASCIVVKGATAQAAQSAAAAYEGSGTTCPLTGASITTGGANRLVLWAFCTVSSGVAAVATLTPPSGFTQRSFNDSAGVGRTVGFADKVEATNTTTTYSGSMAFTASDTHSAGVVTLVFS